MNNQFINNLRIYVNWIPFVGIIVSIFAFIYVVFFKNGEILFAITYALVLLITHLLVWIPAKLTFKKIDNQKGAVAQSRI